MGNCACHEVTPAADHDAYVMDVPMPSEARPIPAHRIATGAGLKTGLKAPRPVAGAIELSVNQVEAGMMPRTEHRKSRWDVSDAEVALAIHDEDIPDSPFEAVEKKLVQLLQAGAEAACEDAPRAPTALRASATAGSASRSGSWHRASHASDTSGFVTGGLPDAGTGTRLTEARFVAMTAVKDQL
jgi:hypothetical protein